MMDRRNRVKYPVGEQSFRELRRGGYLYVDKTEYIDWLINQNKFIFLARPRRFGKSLLLSTIEWYFRGAKDLFEGTWLGDHEEDWKQYPVLHFDMSITSGKSAETVEDFLHRKIEEYENEFELEKHSNSKDVGLRFNELIRKIYKKTGNQVVILIDEYDNGILETLYSPEETQEAMSNVLRAFYRQPKAATEAIKFCMVTGVARFGSYTLFSGPNNYFDISMMDDYAAICGITQEELLAYFGSGIERLSNLRKISKTEMVEELRLKYDSYRFSQCKDLVYNPFSLLCAFTEGRLEDYWIKSGTSKVFVKYLSRSEFDLMELQNLWVTRSRMEGKYTSEDTIPLLFQTGYLTIKEVDYNANLYRLGIPNGEVQSALVEQLMPIYMGLSENQFPKRLADLKAKVREGNVSGWIEDVKSFISGIPYHLFGPKEGAKREDGSISHFERTYHIIVHMIFQMLNLETRSEIAVSGGRIDMVVGTDKYLYVIEFKLDGTAKEALQQIDDRGYLIPWQSDGRKVYKVGIVFSSKERNISAYAYEPKE